MPYIDSDKLIKELFTMYKEPTSTEDFMTVGYDKAIADVVVTAHRQPTADVQEVKHGKWISRKNESKHKDWWTCSECQGRFYYEWKFCPNYGEDMRKEKEDE